RVPLAPRRCQPRMQLPVRAGLHQVLGIESVRLISDNRLARVERRNRVLEPHFQLSDRGMGTGARYERRCRSGDTDREYSCHCNDEWNRKTDPHQAFLLDAVHLWVARPPVVEAGNGTVPTRGPAATPSCGRTPLPPTSFGDIGGLSPFDFGGSIDLCRERLVTLSAL